MSIDLIEFCIWRDVRNHAQGLASDASLSEKERSDGAWAVAAYERLMAERGAELLDEFDHRRATMQ